MAFLQIIITHLIYLCRLPAWVDWHSRFSISVELFSLESRTIQLGSRDPDCTSVSASQCKTYLHSEKYSSIGKWKQPYIYA